MEQQQKLQQLLKKENKSRQDLVDLITILRKTAFRSPDAALEYSHKLLASKNSAGDQVKIYGIPICCMLEPLYLDVYSQAALDLQMPQKTIMTAIHRLFKLVGASRFVQRLEAVAKYLTPAEKKQSYPHLRSFYDSLIRSDLTDYDSRKRAISLLKSEGKLDQYVERLNSFIEDNPSDVETWQELGKVYTERSNYAKAAFCYEELILLKPQNDHFFVRLAELYTTLGGLQNLNVAKDYFSYVVARDQKNYRALWGLNRTTKTLLQEFEKQCSELVRQLNEVTLNQLIILPDVFHRSQTTRDVLKKLYSRRTTKGVSIEKLKL